MALLEIEGLCKAYGDGSSRTEVLHDVNVSIEAGEFVAIVGFSGSGKTTLISTIAGLLMPDAGEIRLKGRRVTSAGPDRGVVFQSYSLMPWLTVQANVALAVDAVFPQWSKQQRRAHVARYVDLVGLSHAATRRPAQLSGGMRQRVAVARALATKPEILLLDEPLSALDALTRARLQDEIEALWRTERKTVVMVTNDVDEALLLADRIIPLTPAPRATLGQEFRVGTARPRNRHAANHDAEYRRLRAEITQYLVEAGRKRTPPEANPVRLPDVIPITSSDFVPKAVRAVTRTKVAANVDKFAELYNVTKTFPTPQGPLTVVDELTLDIRKGEFVSLIGHSGCGKSTVLSMVAGLTDVTDGGIALDGREVTAAGPDRGVVFQAPNLLPWLTARKNVAVGVDRVYPHASHAERRDITEYYLARVGLADSLDKRASELSNGMKQRVGLARAFALSPKLLLLDEPFGMLDALTRWELQEVLMEIWQRTRVTAICVTHDVDEAILLADRVVMMTNGPRAQIGNIMHVDLPRPRTRKALLEHPKYYEYREELMTFLEKHERGRAPATAAAPSVRSARAAAGVASAAVAALSLMAAGSARAEGFGPVVSAARETKPIVDLRLRSESVDQDGMSEDAQAITLRARLGFETGKAWSTTLLAEADLLWPLDSDYNSTVNGKTAFPVVADAETYELNRLQLTNTSIENTTLTVGRQRINLDDQRFVGNVGWRQNEQTFDSVRVVNKTITNVTIDLAYVDQVNRVFGKDSPVGRYNGSSYLANLAYPLPIGKLTGFAYVLDFREAPRDSTETYGLRFTGERPIQKIKVSWLLSYARQQERANNPLTFEDDFYALELTGTFRQYSLGAGFEVLEGDGTKGFTTPLATLHKFDGWADKFLATPANGLERRYVTLGYLKKGVGALDTFSANAVYHEFRSSRLGIDYGREIDLQLQAKWRRFNALLKYAGYNADSFATDTTKYWLELDYIW